MRGVGKNGARHRGAFHASTSPPTRSDRGLINLATRLDKKRRQIRSPGRGKRRGPAGPRALAPPSSTRLHHRLGMDKRESGVATPALSLSLSLNSLAPWRPWRPGRGRKLGPEKESRGLETPLPSHTPLSLSSPFHSSAAPSTRAPPPPPSCASGSTISRRSSRPRMKGRPRGCRRMGRLC